MSDNKASNKHSEAGLELDKVNEDYVHCTRDLIKLNLKWAEQGISDKGGVISLTRATATMFAIEGCSKAQFLKACGVSFDEVEKLFREDTINSN